MTTRKLILVVLLASGAIGAVYGTQRPATEEPLPAFDVPVPQIVITAPRVANEQR